MAIINDACSCGQAVIVRTGDDSRVFNRADGKQVIYPDELTVNGTGAECNIFRCRSCGEPISETCKAAAYGLAIKGWA